MKPTEQLKEEHKAIKLVLKILEKFCEKLESKGKVNPEHLKQTLEFIKGFADKCHHAKEEELLFPAMEEAGIPKQGGPIGVMLLEHTMGRDYVKGMSEAGEKYGAGDQKVSSQIIESARNYIALLTQHIEKEDNILFPMADMSLSKERQENLSKEFESLERERIGIGKHKEFHRLLHNLKSVYLETHKG
jgi:hemerythrin-like domain-containing protein